MDQIVKRDGTVVQFHPEKIKDAVLKALNAVGMPSESVSRRVTRDVLKSLDLSGESKVSIEDVQDKVETALMKRGLTSAAKSYILYREERARARKAIVVEGSSSGTQSVTDKVMMIATRDGEQAKRWDRSILQCALVNAGAPVELAAAVAKHTEDCIIGSGLKLVGEALIREMANAYLNEHGSCVRLKEFCYKVPASFVDGLMGDKSNENSNIVNNNPEAVGLAVSELVLKQYALDQIFSEKVNAAHSSGMVYVHDLGYPVRVYCGSHSIEYIKKYGLKGLNNLNTTSKPAKSASVLTGHLNTFLASMQSCYAGALGLGFINVFYAPLLEGLSGTEIHQIAQELIFNGSQNAFSRGGQTLFLDFNIHTGVPGYLRDVPAIGPGGLYMWQSSQGQRHPLHEVSSGGDWCLALPDGVMVLREHDGKQTQLQPEKGRVLTYGDFEPLAMEFALALLDVWYEGDANGRIFEFPKCDFHVSQETLTVPEQYRVFKRACELAAHNGSTYFVFDRDAVTLSSCCFTGDTKVLIKGGEGGDVHLVPFSEIDSSPYKQFKTNLTVFHNGGWSQARLVKLSGKGKRIFKFTTMNNKVQKVTEDHIVPTLAGDKPAKDVTTEDYLLFNTEILEAPRINMHTTKSELSFAQGVLIGAYLGDGSIEDRGNKPAVHFSFNREKYELLLGYLKQAAVEWEVDGEFVLHTPYNNVYPLYIGSWGLKEKIREWVTGGYCYEKELNIGALKETSDFRRGILFGLYSTDGGNNNRIYTTSAKLVEELEAVCTSLGMSTIVDVSDRRGDGTVVIRGQGFNRNYPVYCIRWYENGTRRQYSDVYRHKNNSAYFRVREIEELPEEENVYCFEIKDENEPYFTLPNGIITHNCRLRTAVTDMSLLKHPERLRTLGFQNVTVNVPQAAYRASRLGRGNLEGLFEEIDHAMDIAVEAHLQKRKFIERIMEKPGRPLWQLGKASNDGSPYVDLDSAMYIIGVIGVNDAVHFLTGKEMHESPEALEMGLQIAGHMYLRTKEYTEKYKLQFKIEESPAESAARKLAMTDLVFFHDEASKVFKGEDESVAYYTNSVHLAADAPVSLAERVEVQAKFNPIIEAGAITHAFIGEQQPSPEAIEWLIKDAFARTQSAQITFSPEFTYCNHCGKNFRGLVDKCPSCGSTDVEGETRIVGYFSKVRNFNLSKLAELRARQHGRYHVEE